jgi:hypothetical protein
MNARMLTQNFDLIPDAKDTSEKLNPQVKRTRPQSCQFYNSEIKQMPTAPQSALPPQRYQSAKKLTDTKTKELVGQTMLEHIESKLK